MNKRIWLATGLMLLGVLGVLGFQGYWTYQTYRQTEQRLQQEARAALTATGHRAQVWQRRRLLEQYRRWLRDTTHVRISCHVNRAGVTQFRLTGYRNNRLLSPTDHSEMSFEDFRERVPRMTPTARTFFIRRFTEGTIWGELGGNYVFYHTQWLGDQLSAALQQNRMPGAVIRRIMREELARRGFGSLPFQLRTRAASTSASLPQPTPGFPVLLPPLAVGLPNGAPQTVLLALPAASGPVLHQLRGVLLASGLLSLLVLGCFGYAVGTMRRQKQLADLKDDFTHNMTHELKTPVTTIQLAADSLGHFAPDPVTTHEYAALISEQAGRLGQLIDQILRSVTLEQGTLPLTRQPLNVTVLLNQVLAQYQPLFRQAGKQLRGPVTSLALPCLGDALHLANALATLLDNALKYGGPIVTVHMEATPAGLCLLVHDNGLGIAKIHQSQVFDKFFRVPTGNRHAVKGYGLGLHYARQVAQRHGGSLHLSSSPTLGTTFTLTLPC